VRCIKDWLTYTNCQSRLWKFSVRTTNKKKLSQVNVDKIQYFESSKEKALLLPTKCFCNGAVTSW
jgi:hypothetical protein